MENLFKKHLQPKVGRDNPAPAPGGGRFGEIYLGYSGVAVEWVYALHFLNFISCTNRAVQSRQALLEVFDYPTTSIISIDSVLLSPAHTYTHTHTHCTKSN